MSGASLGAAAGAILGGPAADRFGRKKLLIIDAGIYALGAILSAVTVDAGMLLGARTLIGLAIGADSAIATAYIAEYAPKDRRGSLTMLQQWMITVGHPGVLHRGADHLQRLPEQRRDRRLAAGARAGRGPGADRAGIAHPDARITALAAAPREATTRCPRPWPCSAPADFTEEEVRSAAQEVQREEDRSRGAAGTGRPAYCAPSPWSACSSSSSRSPASTCLCTTGRTCSGRSSPDRTRPWSPPPSPGSRSPRS